MLNMPFLWQQLRSEISPAQVIPDPGLRLHPTPQTLLLMQPVRTLGKGMSEPADPHKIVPNLWSMGILEGGLSPGMPWHPWGVPTSQTWGVECSQGCPGSPGEIPTSSQNPSPTLRELFQGQDPGSSPPGPCPRHELGT